MGSERLLFRQLRSQGNGQPFSGQDSDGGLSVVIPQLFSQGMDGLPSFAVREAMKKAPQNQRLEGFFRSFSVRESRNRAPPRTTVPGGDFEKK